MKPKKIYMVSFYRPQGAGDVIDRVEFFYHYHNAEVAKQNDVYFATIEEIFPKDHNYTWHKQE